MAKAVIMPKAGISVESCIIGSWSKSVGDTVNIGDILFDYETDKASFECESTAEGILLEVFFQAGDEVACLTPVCVVGVVGEDISGLRPSNGQDAAAARHEDIAADSLKPSDTIASPAAVSNIAGAGASPRARNLAEKLGVNRLDAVSTGPRGRVITRDVEALAESLKTGTGIGGRAFNADQAPAVVPESAAVQADDPGYTDEKFSKIRRTISATMYRSICEMAQLTHHHSCDASGIMDYRKQCKAAGDTLGTGGISLNDMVMYAVVHTLKANPDLNAHMIGDDTIRRFQGVHLGMAVDTPRGLMVPTIFNADKKSLKELSEEAKELAELAKSGSINPDLLQGGTFTVSNLGALGVEMFTPIINPPQVAILGVCGIITRIREGAEAIKTYPALGLSLTYDHRAVDGAPASRFAQDLCKNIEKFQLLLALGH